VADQTGPTGAYLTGVADGTHAVTVTVPAGFTATTATSVTVPVEGRLGGDGELRRAAAGGSR